MLKPKVFFIFIYLLSVVSIFTFSSESSASFCSKAVENLSITDQNHSDQIIFPEKLLLKVDLQKEVELSETGYYFQRLATQSAGVKTVYEYLREHRLHHEEGHLLGLSSHRDAYQAMSAVTGLETWLTAYEKYGLSEKDPEHVEKFMKIIAGRDARIVFLVPRELYAFPHKNGYDKRKFLQEEFKWLLDRRHAETLRKTQFVYGAYEAVDPQFYEYLKRNFPLEADRVNYLFSIFQNLELFSNPDALLPQRVDSDRLRRLLQ